MLHCFTSSRALAETGLELGLSISFSGVVTFKNSGELRAVARDAPLDRLLVETDAPYLAPVPHRGRRNEPAFVVETARVLAEPQAGRARPSSPPRRAPTRCGCSPRWRRRGARRVSLSLTILGCGSSAGVPRVAQGWGACDPANPRNRRRRCSVLVAREAPQGRTLALVDASPDLRLQLLDAGVAHLDGVLISHEHADHTHGIDDLAADSSWRCAGASTSTWTRRTSRALQQEVRLRVRDAAGKLLSADRVNEKRLTAGEPGVIEGQGGAIEATPFDLDHGEIAALGFRVGALAYTADLNGDPCRRAGAFSKVSRCGSSTRCATGRIPRISASTRRWRGSRRCGRAAPSSPICTPISTTRRCARACRRASCPPTTACASKDFEGPARAKALDRAAASE